MGKNRKSLEFGFLKQKAHKNGPGIGPNTSQKKKIMKKNEEDPLLKKKDRVPKFKK